MRHLIAVLVVGNTLAASPSSLRVSVPTVREMRLGPIAETTAGMELVFDGPAAPCGERLKGILSVSGSGGIPVDGTVTTVTAGGCSIRFEIPFSAFGPDVLAKANVPAVAWSLAGARSVNGTQRPVTWAGSIPRERVRLTEPMNETLSRFVSVKNVRIGSLGVGTSTVTVDVDLKNPLAFDLQFVDAAYELTVDGEPLARGRKERFLLHARRLSRLVLPVELSSAGILSGLLKAATGEPVEGVLTGIAKLHVPAGELDLPFKFPVTLLWE
jgi:hypothetical protein